jgi:hypothetical protein
VNNDWVWSQHQWQLATLVEKDGKDMESLSCWHFLMEVVSPRMHISGQCRMAFVIPFMILSSKLGLSPSIAFEIPPPPLFFIVYKTH